MNREEKAKLMFELTDGDPELVKKAFDNLELADEFAESKIFNETFKELIGGRKSFTEEESVAWAEIASNAPGVEEEYTRSLYTKAVLLAKGHSLEAKDFPAEEPDPEFIVIVYAVMRQFREESKDPLQFTEYPFVCRQSHVFYMIPLRGMTKSQAINGYEKSNQIIRMHKVFDTHDEAIEWVTNFGGRTEGEEIHFGRPKYDDTEFLEGLKTDKGAHENIRATLLGEKEIADTAMAELFRLSLDMPGFSVSLLNGLLETHNEYRQGDKKIDKKQIQREAKKLLEELEGLGN